ncbi:MAG: MFS transporter [Actinomycetota bacterium]|nr:MFS transporter [Actinomycetota bacterium]
MSGGTSARWWTLAAVSSAVFMVMLDLTVVNVALPQIRNSLDADFSAMQWVIDAYALTLAAFLLTAGSLADTWGRRRVFAVGFVLFTLASWACGMADDALTLNLARGAQGVGAAVLYAVGPALIGHEFRGKARGMAFGVFGGMSGLAIALGPVIGGALTSGPGWRWIFLVNIPVGVVAILITALRVRESRNPRALGTDWLGLVTFSGALWLGVFGLLRGNEEGWTSPLILLLLTGAVVLLAAFVAVERALGPRAMFDLTLFRNRTFLGIGLAALVANLAAIPAVFFEISAVQNLLHFSPWDTGIRFLPLTLTLFVFSALAGALTGRLPMRVLVFVAAAFIGGGLALVVMADEHTAWTVLIPSMVVGGIGLGMFQPLRAATSIGVVAPERSGMASGVNETFQQVGVVLGIAALGAFFENRITAALAADPRAAGLDATTSGDLVAAGQIDTVGAASPEVLAAARAAFVSGFHQTMLVCAALAVVAAVIGLLLIRTRDFHSSALSMIPPEVTDPGTEPERAVPQAELARRP